MMLFSVLFLITLVSVKPDIVFHPHWSSWKTAHKRSYVTIHEEVIRHDTWLANKEYIDKHNDQSAIHGFTLKMNHLGDLTEEEYCTQYSCYRLVDTHRNYTSHKIYSHPGPDGGLHLPETVDWRTKSAVTHVKDQGQCGGCYAFSAVGALEGAHSLAHDQLVSLSEQNLIDCSVPYGNHGCNGGNMYDAFQYTIDNNGIDKEDSYPYRGKQGQCNYNDKEVGAAAAGIVEIPSGSEKHLASALATAGPVAVAIDGSSNAFRFYERGIFNEPHCSSQKLSHAVLVIGYGTENDKPYWIVKNSWGPTWGMKGYIHMAKDKANQCGIATDALFPTL